MQALHQRVAYYMVFIFGGSNHMVQFAYDTNILSIFKVQHLEWLEANDRQEAQIAWASELGGVTEVDKIPSEGECYGKNYISFDFDRFQEFGLLANDVQTAGKYSINVMDSYLLSKCFELKLSSSRLNLAT